MPVCRWYIADNGWAAGVSVYVHLQRHATRECKNESGRCYRDSRQLNGVCLLRKIKEYIYCMYMHGSNNMRGCKACVTPMKVVLSKGCDPLESRLVHLSIKQTYFIKRSVIFVIKRNEY